MKIIFIIKPDEITTLNDWNKKAEKRWADTIAANPDRDPETLIRLYNEKPHPWNTWTATNADLNTVNPVIINTNGINPFYQFACTCTVEFDLTAEQLRGTLEGNAFHLLIRGNGWDYGIALTNVSWKKENGDWWDMIDPDPSKTWIKNPDQIIDGKDYHITCISGWGYVFINERQSTKED